ncbi:hypothetical protein [Thiohalorhabdus methylotrophus]|uniref:DUF2490 domain-containing protein n=1 Tax=Thiohalorhabdus methylotrophus TaxID=3242694 RepID=A0ABV4TQR5_9GAMM
MDSRLLTALFAGAAVLLGAPPLLAADRSPFGLEVEGGAAWLSRNDVRIPGDSGTRFDLLDVVDSGPYGFYRIYADWDLNRRHGLRLGVAPLEVSSTGSLGKEVRFAGTTFEPGRTEATYRFSTYRLTYRYTFASGPRSVWRIGFTGLVRDAKIQLEQDGRSARDSNVGFVPLLHLHGRHGFAPGWDFVLDFDGLAAPQGRALDLGLKVMRDVGDNWQVGLGYRALEGGVDNDEVYNFAWLHYGFASVAYRF